MKKFITSICALVVLVACKNETAIPENMTWEFDKVIPLDNVNPIGVAMDDEAIYLSDGDNNRVVKVDTNGKILLEYDGFERPMHIDFGKPVAQITDKLASSALNEAALFVPEYGRDSIAVVTGKKRRFLVLNDSLDAPAAISVHENEIALADFYNHRILYYNGTEWISFGTEGKELGMFYYPTDVQITKDAIYVADAYNNRGQVFDKKGKAIAAFGKEQKMNAATGIFVTDTEIYLTDFEHKRVLVFNKDYSLKQELKTEINKPTDVIVLEGKLLITDYGKGALIQYKKVPAVKDTGEKNS